MLVKLGRTSRKRLATCNLQIKEWIYLATVDEDCPCDFGIVCGWRGEEAQNKAFREGKSNAKWGESDHNHVDENGEPDSEAVDLAPYDSKIKNYVWDANDPRYELLEEFLEEKAEALGYEFEWGGTYLSIVDKDGNRGDKPHYSYKGVK